MGSIVSKNVFLIVWTFLLIFIDKNLHQRNEKGKNNHEKQYPCRCRSIWNLSAKRKQPDNSQYRRCKASQFCRTIKKPYQNTLSNTHYLDLFAIGLELLNSLSKLYRRKFPQTIAWSTALWCQRVNDKKRSI